VLVIHERQCTCQFTVLSLNRNAIIRFVLLFSCIALYRTLQCTYVPYIHRILTTHNNKKLPYKLLYEDQATIHGNLIDRIHDTFDIVRDNSIQRTYCTVLYYTVLHCPVLVYTVLYCTVLYWSVLYWSIRSNILYGQRTYR
jgi:hypothetical protein